MRKIVDLAHLLVWMFFLCYLLLATYERTSTGGIDLRPLFLGPYSECFHTAFWLVLVGVPIFSVVVVVHVVRTSRPHFAEILVAAAAWGMLLYNLSFLRG
ncbi:hypothetical protein [Stenotrophomonas bentonitica]|uniref:hypothetical protein n=1 Tax=Stenotrophomonas bentonitica TaxID=1450134 RepID=UPI00345EAB43